MTTQATQIRDAIFQLLQTLPGYVRVRKVPMRQLQPEETPSLTVYSADEVLTADEDATASVPHFIHEATFNISVIRGFDDPLVLDGKSDDDMDVIQETLLRSPTLNSMFEGVLMIRRSHAWPQQGDAYYVELRMEMTVQYRSSWDPVIPDDFLTATVTLAPGGDLAAAQEVAIIELPQG